MVFTVFSTLPLGESRRGCYVLKPPLLCKCIKLSSCKLGPIIRGQQIWYTILSKDFQGSAERITGCQLQMLNFNEATKVVTHHQQCSPLGVAEVCTDLGPWLSHDLMLDDCFLRWSTLMSKTHITLRYVLLDIRGHSWPEQ